jgi:hypothetical protein
MMMAVMSRKTLLSESEVKAYKLITRVKLRNELRDIEANLVYHSLQMFILKKRKGSQVLTRAEFEINYNYQRRSIIACIDHKKEKDLSIKLFEFIPTKDRLFDIYSQMDEDIRDIKKEIDSLSYVNDSIVGYAESQNDVIKYLKKNIYATKLMFGIIEKKPQTFGKLAEFDRGVLNDDTEFNDARTVFKENTGNNEEPRKTSRKSTRGKASVIFSLPVKTEQIPDSVDNNVVNPNQFDQNFNRGKIIPPMNLASQFENGSDEDDDEFYSEDWSAYNVPAERIKEHFNFLFLNQKDSNRNSKYNMKKNTIKTIMTIRNMKHTQNKLKNILTLKTQRQHKNTESQEEDDKNKPNSQKSEYQHNKDTEQSPGAPENKAENKLRGSKESNLSKSFYS